MITKPVNPFLQIPDMKIINQHLNASLVEVIKITMTPTDGFTAGIMLGFATGTFSIDWKDGTVENFTSGVELTHTYASTGTYVAEISGVLSKINQFVADNCRITKIEDFKSGLLTNFQLHENLYSGSLDLSNATVSGTFYTYNNTGLTAIIFASSGNGKITDLQIMACKLTSLDFSNVPLGDKVWFNSNTGLTSVTFASSGNSLVTSFYAHFTKLSTLDLSNLPVSGTFYTYSSTSLVSITFASSGNGNLNNFRLYKCNLNYIDIVSGGQGINVNNALVRLDDCAMNVTDVNHMLVDFDSIASSGYTGRVINIGGTNAAPDNSSGGYDGLAAKSSLEGKGFTVTV
jgi:hypothetical protein